MMFVYFYDKDVQYNNININNDIHSFVIYFIVHINWTNFDKNKCSPDNRIAQDN